MMAEFQDVVKWKRRLCRSIDDCKKCPLGSGICEILHEDCADESMIKALENIVMQWSEENPEPLYPTWGEWFIERGELVDGWENIQIRGALIARCSEVFGMPIPDDIAERLGIEPKQ